MQKLTAVDREMPVPLTTQVVGAVLSAVPPGASEVLPSRRDMAEQLGVGLTTLNQAVTRLKVGGYAFEAVGVGTVVRRPANTSAASFGFTRSRPPANASARRSRSL